MIFFSNSLRQPLFIVFAMNLLNRLVQTVTNHLCFLVYYLNPLVTENSVRYQKTADPFLSRLSNKPAKAADEFLAPITILLASLLYGVLYVVYAAEGHLDLETVKGSPEMMYHQIVPPSIWHQLDGAVFFANCTVVAIYCAILSKRAGFTAGRYISRENKKEKEAKTRKDKDRRQLMEVHINERSKKFGFKML